MPLAITCSCGALLEIDDRFIGQRISCPDCNRPLDTKLPVPEPTSTSGLALSSFLLATAGAFTLIGSLLAVACGVVALNRLRDGRERAGGRRFALAGVALGAAGTLVTGAMLAWPDLVRVDGWLRAIEWAGKIEYNLDDPISINSGSGNDAPDRPPTIQRPSPAWGQSTYRKPDTKHEESDDLLLVNPWDDAYLVCLNMPSQEPRDWKLEGKQRFLGSELVRGILGRMTADSPPPVEKERESKKPSSPDVQECILDIRLGGIDRTFLVRILRAGERLIILAAGTRTSRFERLQPTFVKALESYTSAR